jgi:hypothetical protein
MGLFGKSEPETVDVNDKPLRCQVCGHDTFWKRTHNCTRVSPHSSTWSGHHLPASDGSNGFSDLRRRSCTIASSYSSVCAR